MRMTCQSKVKPVGFELKDDTPIKSKPHRTPFRYQEELNKHIDGLLACGVLKPSETPYVSPIVLVQKKNNAGLRPCVDFRRLNP